MTPDRGAIHKLHVNAWIRNAPRTILLSGIHVQRSMKQTILSFIALPAFLLTSAQSFAQVTTKDGISLVWDRELAVVDDSMSIGGRYVPAHTITVFETDASTAMELLKVDYTPISTSIGGKPMKVSGARLTQVSESPVDVMVVGNTQKKAGLARLTLAIMANDSTVLPDNGAQEELLRGLAVRLNKAVVGSQIDRYQQELDKTAEKLGSTQEDVAKAEKNLTKHNASLEKAKSKRAKLERNGAQLQGEISGLERKFALSNDPKDLQRLTKARQKLAKTESAQAKLMQQEAKAQGNINKYQDSAEKHGSRVDEHAESKEDLQRIIAELKRKQDSIR
jgi:hypothetical protein